MLLAVVLFSMTAPQVPAEGLQASSFIENKGQWDSNVHFLGKTNGLNMWLTDDGMVLDYHKFVRNPVKRKLSMKLPIATPRLSRGTVFGDVVRITLDGAQPSSFAGQGKVDGELSYFVGNNRARWASGARRFSEARMENPYPGVDVRYYFQSGYPRYDLLIRPGADPSKIGFKVEGVQSTRVRENGDLEMQTPYGSIVEKGLLAYQELGTAMKPVPCRMVVDGDHIHFAVGSYDPTKALVIDPLIFSTYMGGSAAGADEIINMRTDSSGDPCVVGQTASSNFPTSVGAYKTTNPAQIGFVAKLNSTGTSLLAGTYFGGSGGTLAADEIDAVAIASDGIVIAGTTYSTDLPTTAGVIQTSNNAASVSASNAFVAKLNTGLTSLTWSTYLGGQGFSVLNGEPRGDAVSAMALDSSNNPVIVGAAYSNDFPTTSGAYLVNTPNQFSRESGFVSKLSSDGKSLVASTYLGGQFEDLILGAALDASGNPVVCGQAFSHDFPTTGSAYMPTNPVAGSTSTGFVSKLSADLKTLTASTFLGGGGGDAIVNVVLDGGGNPVVLDDTISYDFPTTPNAFQASSTVYLNGQQPTAVVAKLSADLSTLSAGTYLGSNGIDSSNAGEAPVGLALDAKGNPIVSGATFSADFPTTAGAYQTQNKSATAGKATFFVSKVSADGTLLLSSTFIGGSDDHIGPALATDSSKNPILAGATLSTDYPVTSGVFQGSNPDSGSSSGVVSKLSFPVLALALTSTSAIGGQSVTGRVTLSTNSGPSGALVSLSSNNAAAVVPVSASIAANGLSQTFTITTSVVSADTTATITATYNSVNYQATLKVMAATVSAVTFTPAFVLGSKPATCKLTLTGPVPAGGAVATLSGAGSWTIPASVPVPGGQSSVSFSVTTIAVKTNELDTLSATLQGATQTGDLSINAPVVSKVTATPSSVVGGNSTTGTVVLTGPGATGGDVVTLTPTSSIIGVPATVTVPAGKSSTTFTITSKGVSASTTAGVTASFGITSQDLILTLNPATISTLTVSSPTLIGGVLGTGAVTLDGQAGSQNVLIALTGTGPIAMPPSTTVIHGSTAIGFRIPSQPVSVATAATITARVGAVSKSVSFTVLPAPIARLILPSSVVGGASAQCLVTISQPAGKSGDVISLTGSGPWTLPSTVTIPAGETAIGFAVPTSAVSANTTATVTATLGTTSKTGSTIIAEAKISSFVLAPSSVKGGASSYGIVTLNGSAGPSGDVVTISGAGPWTLPTTVTVLPGSNSALFLIQTKAVASTTTAKVTVTLGVSASNATLTITP